MSFSSDLAAAQTAITAATTVPNCVTAMNLLVAVLNGMNAQVVSNTALIASSLADDSKINGGPSAVTTRVALTNQEQGLEKVAGTTSSNPATELAVPGSVVSRTQGQAAKLAITTPKVLTAGARTVAYGGVTLAAAGGSNTGYVWSVVAGSLPVGMSMNSSGVISGTPTTTSANTFVVTVVDSIGNAHSRLFTLAVA
jgi:hypothetical protein